MPLLIGTPHMSVSIVVPVRRIDAVGFMVLLIAPSMRGSIIDPFGFMAIPVLTPDFVFNLGDRISVVCDVWPVATDPRWATTAGIGCGRYSCTL